MTNQIVNKNVSRMPVLSENQGITIRFVIAFTIIVLFLIGMRSFGQYGNEATVNNPVSAVEPQSLSTQNTGAMTAPAGVGTTVNSGPTPRYRSHGFSTQMYWDYEAARAAQAAQARVGTTVNSGPTPRYRSQGFSTQMYWDYEAARAALATREQLEATVSNGPTPRYRSQGFSTQMYWDYEAARAALAADK